MEATDDLTLLREYAANNSEKAFEELVLRYAPLVYSGAMRQVGDPHLAQEVSQAVFTILAKKAAHISQRTILSGWLFKTTRFVAMAQKRMATRRQQYEQEFSVQPQHQFDTPDPLWEQIAPLLDEALMRLGEKDRQALLLRYFENKSMAEVGKSFGCAEDAARMRVHRALERLRKIFARRGVDSTSAVIAGSISANSAMVIPVTLAKTFTVGALTKGATTSTSTLTLAKGALKIMAWTKTKTIIVGTVAALLVGGVSVPVTMVTIHMVRRAFYPNIAGTWEGVMPMGGVGVNRGESTSTRVVVKLAKKGGGYVGSFDAIDEGRTGLPVADVVYDFPAIQLSVYPKRNMVYQGKMNHSATRMDFSGIVLRKTDVPPTYTPLEEEDFVQHAGSDIQGYWKGGIFLGKGAQGNYLQPNSDLMDTSNTLPINLKIAGQSDGTYRAEMDNPMQGADGQPASVKVDDGKIKVTLNSNNGMLRLDLDASGQEMKGSWVQNGQLTPAFFKRANYEAELAQQNEEDFSFSSPSDLAGHWRGSWDVTLGKIKVNIPMQLDIAKMPDGTYSAAIANLEQLGNDSPAPATSFEFSPPNLHAKWKWNNTKYDGRLENGRIVGTWSEGGGGFSLVFDRTNE